MEPHNNFLNIPHNDNPNRSPGGGLRDDYPEFLKNIDRE
jgi:hypothetical protein